MKKLLSVFLVLAVASMATASEVWIEPIPEGEPGSRSNPLYPSDEIDILVYTDTSLVGLNALLTITGGAGTGAIIDAIKVADAGSWGWDSAFSFDPIFDELGQWADIAVGNFNGSPTGAVAYYTFHCTGGEDPYDVILTLTPSTSRGGSADTSLATPNISGTITVYQIPEPATIALLGLGGLFLLRRRK